MKMELIEGSETSAIGTQTPGNYPKENILYVTKTLGVVLLNKKITCTPISSLLCMTSC